jgi:template-activating factor I
MTGELDLEKLISEAFEKVADIEDEMEKINVEQVEEEARLQHVFDLKKAPLYTKRNAVLSEIPMFWMDALNNHQVFSAMITDDDMSVLEHLTNIEVTRSADDFRSFAITFHFSENPYFSNKTLVKELTATGDQSIKVTDTPIQWKDGKDLTKQVTENGKRKSQESFFCFFSDESDDGVEIANLLITDFYPNAISYYQGQDDEEDDDINEIDLDATDDDEDEDEDEEEDEDME